MRAPRRPSRLRIASSRAGPCVSASFVAASRGSDPASAPSSAAASATVRAMGPAVSWLCAIGMMPVRLTRPSVGLMPTSEALFDGDTIDPSVSVPTAAAPRLAATAAPEPELEPDGLRSSAYGIPRLAAAAAPSARRMRRPEVRPLAEVRLAENHRARRPQSLDDERVCRGRRAGERQRTGRRHHAIAGGDVVLDQNRECRGAVRARGPRGARRRARRRSRRRPG